MPGSGPSDKGVVTFAWNGDGVNQGGRCYDVQRSFSLCDEDAIASKCLLARIPWQTPLSVVQCCFSCCLAHWQDRLGLNEVYNHWWSNKRFAKTEFSVKFDRRSIPGLNSTVLQFNSIKRFSMLCSCGRLIPKRVWGRTSLSTMRHTWYVQEVKEEV